MKAKVGLCWGIVCAMMACGAMAAERADFTTGEGTNGWTISAAGYVSPTYVSAVDRISLSYSGVADGSATVSALANGGGEAQVATLSAAANAATFDFPETTDFHAFRISTTGDWRLFSFAADVSAAFLAVPSNVVATALTTDSLEASWDPVADATGYRISIWTNRVVGASNGTEFWIDDFSKAAASGTSPGALDPTKFNTSYSDETYWECESYIYPSTTSGAIRIGGADKDKAGRLRSPHLSGGDWYLRMKAWRYSADDGTDMPIYRNSSGSISLVKVVSFTKGPGEPEEFLIKLPTLIEGDHLEFCSFTNRKPRVILDRVALVSGYSEGVPTPDVFREVSVDAATSCTLENLPPSEPVFVRVTATGTHGLSSEASTDVAVDLAHPPPRTILNAFPISDLEDGIYSQNFDSLSYVVNTTSGSPWFNGWDLTYWQLWQDDLAPANISFYDGGNQTGAKFVALAANAADPVRALGARTKQGTKMAWGIAFTNDTDSVVKLTDVSYSVQQWGFANTDSHALALSYLVTNKLDWTANFADGWLECCDTDAQCLKDVTHETPVVADVTYAPSAGIRVKPEEVLYLRWTLAPPASGNSALMAIDDLAVVFTNVSRALVIHLVDRGK